LGVAERPYLISLDALTVEAAQVFVLVSRTRRASFDQQLRHGVDRVAGHACDRAQAVALDHRPDDLRPFRSAQPVHMNMMLEECDSLCVTTCGGCLRSLFGGSDILPRLVEGSGLAPLRALLKGFPGLFRRPPLE